MKQLTVVRCLFLFIVALMGRLDTCKASETNSASVPMTQIHTAYEALINARNLNDILKQPEHWKDDFRSPSRDALCLTLLDHLRSRGVLEMDAQGEISTTHDLRMVGGRCAWAIEKLLQCDLPPVTTKSTPQQIEEVRRLVIQTMTETKGKEAIKHADDLVKSASPLEKKKLAQGADTSPYVLARLADEEDVSTRRSVASNPKTPPSILARLAGKDTDDEVRSRAVKNLEVSRTLVDDKDKKGK